MSEVLKFPLEKVSRASSRKLTGQPSATILLFEGVHISRGEEPNFPTSPDEVKSNDLSETGKLIKH